MSSKDEKHIPTPGDPSEEEKGNPKPKMVITVTEEDGHTRELSHERLYGAITEKDIHITITSLNNAAVQLDSLFDRTEKGIQPDIVGNTIVTLGVQNADIVITKMFKADGCTVFTVDKPIKVLGHWQHAMKNGKEQQLKQHGRVSERYLLEQALPRVLTHRSLDNRGSKDEKPSSAEIIAYARDLVQLHLCMMALDVANIRIICMEGTDNEWVYYCPPQSVISDLWCPSKDTWTKWKKIYNEEKVSRSEKWAFFSVAFLPHLKERANSTNNFDVCNKAFDMMTKNQFAEFECLAKFLVDRWEDTSVHERFCEFLVNANGDGLSIFYKREEDRENELKAAAEKKNKKKPSVEKKKQTSSSAAAAPSSSAAAAAATTSAAASAPPRKTVNISSDSDNDKPVSSLSKNKKLTENVATKKPSESTAVGKKGEKDKPKASKKRDRSPSPASNSDSSDDEAPVSKKLKAAAKKDKEELKKKKEAAKKASAAAAKKKKKREVVVVSSNDSDDEERDPLELSADDEEEDVNTDEDSEFEPQTDKSDSEHSVQSVDSRKSDTDEGDDPSSESEDDSKKKKKKK